MTLAAINWLPITINLCLVLFVVVCFLMTLIVLMQRPKQEGLGAAFGGGMTDQVFGASTTSVLQKGTIFLGSMFFLLSLILAVLVGQQNKQRRTVTDKELTEQTSQTPVVAAEKTPEQLLKETLEKSLANELPTEPVPAPAPVPTLIEAPVPTPPPVVVPEAPAPPVEVIPVPVPAPANQ